MKFFHDQMNRIVSLESVPKRIVSIVPSQTELLYDLGLKDEVIGITKFCVHPESWFKLKERIGGTKKLNIEKIRSLKPDLIIGNKEENTKEDIEALEKFSPVWMSDIFSFDDAISMIKSIGEIVDRSEQAEKIIDEIKLGFSKLKTFNKPKSVLYFIWKDPYYLAGKQTFIDDMIHRNGLKNLCLDDRYPVWSQEKYPEVELVFLSSEPYSFKQKHIDYFQKLYPSAKILLVDGEMFSWYGSRMLHASDYYQELFKEITS